MDDVVGEPQLNVVHESLEERLGCVRGEVDGLEAGCWAVLVAYVLHQNGGRGVRQRPRHVRAGRVQQLERRPFVVGPQRFVDLLAELSTLRRGASGTLVEDDST